MKIMMANVYDSILDENKIQLAAEKKGKLYIGALWFEPVDESIKQIINSIEISDEASNVEIANAAYKLSKEYGMLAKDGSSWGCYAHWSWVNNLAESLDEYFDNPMNILEKRRAEIEKMMCSGEKLENVSEIRAELENVKAQIAEIIGK